MTRIRLTDTGLSMITKMSEGNPGALRVLMELLQHGAAIDPDATMGGGFASILDLDTLELYGPRIWMLYKDVCQEKLRLTIAVLRARQLGFTSDTAIKHAVDNRGDGLDVIALVAKVEERLPKFQREEHAHASK